MVQRRLPQAILALSMALLLSSCERVPYGDQLPVTPNIPREEALNDVKLPIMSADCPVLNKDPATTTVEYTNAERGISFSIPYNEHWGSEGHPTPAFVEHEPTAVFPFEYVLFGPPAENFGPDPSICTPGHAYELTYLPPRSAAEAERAIRADRTEIVPDTKVRTINGFTVVQFTDAGLCNFPTMEVIGTKYNYNFTTNCGGIEEEQWAYMEAVINSMKLF